MINRWSIDAQTVEVILPSLLLKGVEKLGQLNLFIERVPHYPGVPVIKVSDMGSLPVA